MSEYLIENGIDDHKWDDFCDEHEEAWFWHTSGWIKYCEHSRFGVDAQNLSFMIVHDDKIMAIVPLLLENDKNKGSKEFTFSGGPTPFYLVKRTLEKRESSTIQDLIWAEIERLSLIYNVGRIWMKTNVNNNKYLSDVNIDNPLARRGFFDTSLYSCIIRLSPDEKILLSEMRKGHKAAVKKSERQLTVICYDNNIINIDKISQFRDIYFNIAGKITRPVVTFDMLFKFIKNKRGLLFEAVLDNRIIGYSLVILYKQYAYYAMACVVQEYKDYNVSHFLEWAAFRRLKQEGVIYYELGEQHFESSLSYIVTDKMKSISSFKRGFGGRLYLQCSGEYFFTKDYFNNVLTERVHNYAKTRWG